MNDLSSRISALSADKQQLLELLRRQKEGKGARRPGAPEPPRGPKRLTEPFSLVSAADRAKLPPDLEDAYPLTMVQLGMLYHMEMTPDAPVPAYHNVNSFHLIAPLDLAALQEAVSRLVVRHVMMRTSFDLTSYSEPLQLVHRSADLPVIYEDFRHLPDKERAGAVQRFILDENRNLVDVTRPPLIRYFVHHRTDRSFQFTLTEPHAISDGWSTMSTLSEIFEVYFALLRGETPAPEPPVSAVFRDFVFLERQVLESEEARRYWRGQLAGWEPPRLPRWSDATVPDSLDHKPTISFDTGLVAAVERLSRTSELPFKSFLLAAHLKVMGFLTGREDGITGISGHGRPEDVDGERARGLFLNSLPLRVPLTGGSWMDLVRRVFQAEMAMFPHRRYPLAALQQLAGAGELFEVLFTYLQFHNVRSVLGDGKLTLSREGNSDLSVTNFAMAATWVRDPLGAAELELTLERNDPGLTPAQIRATFDYYIRVLTAMTADPQAPHGAFSPLSAAEVQQVLVEWNDTRTARRTTAQRIHEPFERQAAAHPERVAVVFGEDRLTYGELNRRANRLAHRLRALGAGPGDLVGVHLSRSLEMVPALLGILKAGAGYLPLEVALPADRLHWMLASLGVRCVLTQTAHQPALAALASELPELRDVLCLDACDLAAEPESDPEPVGGPEDVAYVIFTSGSTGRPKGVVVRHEPVLNLIEWADGQFGLGPQDRVLFTTALSFDLSVYDVFGLLAGGGSIHVASEEDLQEPERLVELLVREPVTFWDSAPAALSRLVPFFPPPGGAGMASRLRLVFLSGDWIPVALPDQVRAAFPGARVISLGGATEATVWSNVYPIGEVDPRWPSIPYGRPIDNARYHVLDRHLRPCPFGVPGALYIAGGCLASGYSQDPVLTADKFVPDPYSEEPGAVMYRTGDLARYFADGNLEFLGRMDFQVKIRGYRIELGEIETALSQHPAVRTAVVAVREDQPGDKRLVAYAVPREGRAAEAAGLREHLLAKLPEYMVPAAFLFLPALPLTANGKVDRKALPAPEWRPEASYVAPRTPAEEVIAGLFAEVLQVDRVGSEDNFLERGGHSLLVTRLTARVREVFGVELAVREVFEAPTVAGLARQVAAAIAAGAGVAVPDVEPAPRDEPLPLSFAQQRLWFLDRLQPGSTVYNIALPTVVRGDLSVPVLERSLEEIARRHETLRTTFVDGPGGPVQVVAPPSHRPLPVVDLQALPAAGREAEVRRLAVADARRPFDLARGPLLRTILLRLEESRHALLLNMHHIISDAWSLGMLVDELTALYTAFAAGRPSPLSGLPVQYGDYAWWQRRWLAGEVLETELAYWRRQLGSAPPTLELPADRPRPAVQTFAGANRRFTVPAVLLPGLRALSRRNGTTLFMTLLAGYEALLARYTDQEDLTVGTLIAGRNQVQTEGLIGFFVNTLVLRADLSGDPSFAALAARVREVTLAAYAHPNLPFEKLVEELQPRRDRSRTPFFQTVFTLETARRAAPGGSSLALEPIPVGSDSAKFDLTVLMEETAEALGGGLEYNRDLFDGATIERLAGHLGALLAGAVADPEQRLSRLPLLAEAERRQLLVDWNDTDKPCPQVPMVHELFSHHAQNRPEATAMADAEGRRITYGELESKSNRLAWHLRSLGVGPDVLVAVCTGRTLLRPVGLLGVVKAGGAYVTLDPDYPPERLAFLMEDSGAPVLLTEESFEGDLPETGAQVVLLDGDWEGDESRAPESGVTPDNLAYVVYTSGSTGKPKGVEIPHAGLMNLVRWHQDLYEVKPGDRGTQIASPAFDASIWELWPYLAGGASLHIPDEETRLSSPGMVRWWAEEGITLAYLMTPLAEGVLDETIPDLPVRALIIGGDRLHRGPDPEVGFKLMNHYGPAEYSVTCTVVQVPPRGQESGIPTIGRAIDNTRIYLLDRRGEPVPVGVPGELYVAGVGLARGYHNRPELTAEKFVPDPFRLSEEDEPGARMYRTADLVRRLPDGDLDFLGRLDHQVKVRGYRIELGEIESVLGQYPGLGEVAVLVREDRPGDRRLVAYSVPSNGARPSSDELRAFLRERLPEYMVPSAFLTLPSLPLTANGKVDRRALPAPEWAPETSYVAPRNPVEERLAGLFAEVLRAGQVGVEDNFFERGGHSLLATRLTSRVREAFGVELPLQAVFETPTVAGLARHVEAAVAAGAGVTIPEVGPAPRDRPLPLSFAQQRLWFLDRLQPESAVYNIPLPTVVRGPLAVPVLERTLAEIVRRHEALRTRFAEQAGEPVQVVAPPSGWRLPVVDLQALPAAGREAEVRRLAAADARRPFDLARGPLLRTTLVRTGASEHALLFNMHHIVSDAWSLGVLVRELSALYTAFAAGRPSPLPELPIQYGDYAWWQRRWLAGEVLETELAYWRGQLGSAPPALELPADRPRPAVQTFAGANRRFTLPAGLAPRLRDLSRRQGTTLFMTLLAGYEALLARYTGQEDLTVGTLIAGRNQLQMEGLIGFFVNTLVLRADLSGDPSFAAHSARVRDVTLAAYAHPNLPFEKLVEELHPQRDLSRPPLFQTVFSLESSRLAERAAEASLDLEPIAAGSETSKFDLTLVMEETAEGLSGGLEYNRDLFDGATIERLAGHLAILLAGAAADPEERLSRLPLLADAERRQLLVDWNDTAKPCPQVPMVHELFAQHARRRPEATAMADAEGRRITYGELEARSNRLAWYLRSLGVGPDVLVAVCTGRTLLRPVGILGVVKAGGAYVTLDPTYPPERLAFLLEDSRVPVLLTEERFAADLPETRARVVLLDGDYQGDEANAPESGVTPDNLAYVVYTSGSTGKPKGVEIPHAGLMNLVRWHQDLYEVKPGDRGTQIASPAFDASIWELWPYLAGGASLHIPDEETRLSSPGMIRWWAEQGITLAYLMTPLAEGVLEEKIPDLQVRALIIGGDRLHRGPDPEVGFKLMNHYGPAEYSVTCTVIEVPPHGQETGVPGIPTIGRAIDNTRIYLLDRHGEPVPVGVPGELYVAGVGLARGYHNRPELTAEKFVPDPFRLSEEDESGARMYRTADLVRRLPDGDLDFLGRLDHQVKVRGYRIELGEIESVLGQHPDLREAAVLVREDRPGDRRLAAYVVPADGAEPSADELRAFLRERLPEYMVPAALLSLPSLPLTANGKVDRRVLPAPEWATETSYVAPRNATEERLAGLFGEVLQSGPVGVEDSFFDRGGHSLLATRLISRVREAFGVELPLRSVFETPTAAGLAAAVAGLSAAVAEPVIARRPRRVDGPNRFPVSFSQLREWILVQLDPGSSAYNAPGGCRVVGPLSAAALTAAVGELVRRHEALRTTFVYDGGEPVQMVAPRLAVPVPLTDLTHLPGPAREVEAKRLAQAELRTPFDLARGPLLRVRLVRLAEQEHLVLFTLHHIVSDGWSMGIFYRELSALYGVFAAGQPSPLPELPVQYGDFAAWQRETLQGEALEEHLEYWRRQLAGTPPLLALPTDRPRPPVQTFRGARQPFRLADEAAAGLRALAGREAASLFVVLLAGYQTVLGRWSRQEDLAVGTFTGNRWRTELEDLIGFFINTLVLRGDLRGNGGGEPTFRELVRRLREVTLEAYAHGQIPFEKLLDELKLERDLSRTPLFQAMLVLQNYPRPTVRRGDTTIAPIEVESDRANFDLTLWLEEEDGRVYGQLEHNLDLFEPATVRRLSGQLQTLLEAAVADPDRRLSDLPLLGEAESHQLLVEWNDTAGTGPEPLPVHRLFELQAERTPNAAALVFDQGQITYRDLDAYAGQLANRLRAAGAGPGSVVGVCLERSPELIVALLGALKAGAAYLPLDPEYPAERLAWMLEDSGAALLLTRERLRGLLPAGKARVVLIEDQAAAVDAGPAPFVDADSPAYVMYTSGSTGRPKGVVVRHGALARYTETARRTYGIAPGDRVLQFASIGFDTSAEEIYPCLAAGASLVLRADARPEEAPEFLAGLARWDVTVVDLPTSYWHELVAAMERDAGLAVPASVRLVILGGERVLPARVQSWFERVETVRLVNSYGPTEGTIVTTHADLSPAAGEAPIGRPVAGARAVVLDRDLRPVPLGVYGELCIGGAGLAQSYRGRPDLTAERFVPDPVGDEPGARLYRTGDLVRHRPDGRLEFGGRVDDQVKVRGVRVEPGEVEAVLASHPALREAAVAARADKAGNARLLAWVVPHRGQAPTVSELRDFLRGRLPEAMLPAAFVTLEALPLLPNGKVDRRALPEPGGERPTLASDYAAPEGELEAAIAGIWRDLLEVDRVGRNDNFFDLGGHSLLLFQANQRLREALGREIPVVDLFRFPTVGQLAGHLAGEAAAAVSVEKVQEVTDRQRQALARQRQAAARAMQSRVRKS